MFGLTLDNIAGLTGGKLLGGQGVQPEGAAIDTRKIKKGELFFALKGEKSDGHDYLLQAVEKGAAGAVVRYCPQELAGREFPMIIVEDVTTALQQTAYAMRRLFKGPVAAVTGSVGKTTTKDMIGAVMAQRGPVLKNEGNYNNELGLPLTLLSLGAKHRSLVLEMGMRGLGEIDFLARISRPEYGVITNIGHTHQELLGSRERIAQAKAELISHLPCQGGLVLNNADRRVLAPWLSNIKSRVLWVGAGKSGDLRADEVSERWDPSELKGFVRFNVYYKNRKENTVDLPLPGRHNVVNALLAYGVGLHLGLSKAEIRTGLENTKPAAMRLEIKAAPLYDALVINDAYNANPASVFSALETLSSLAGERRTVAILGDMYELGSYEEEGHLSVGRKAYETGIGYLVTVGSKADLIARGAEEAGMDPLRIKKCRDNEEALGFVQKILQGGDVVLVKGSRAVKMEEIAAGILSGS